MWENLATGLPQFSVAANYLHQFVVPELNLGPVLDVNSLPDGNITKSDLTNAYKNSPPFSLGVHDCSLNFGLPAFPPLNLLHVLEESERQNGYRQQADNQLNY